MKTTAYSISVSAAVLGSALLLLCATVALADNATPAQTDAANATPAPTTQVIDMSSAMKKKSGEFTVSRADHVDFVKSSVLDYSRVPGVNGTLPANADKPIGEVFDAYTFKKEANWRYFISTQQQELVQVTVEYDIMKNAVACLSEISPQEAQLAAVFKEELVVQYVVNGDDLGLYACEVHRYSSPDNMKTLSDPQMCLDYMRSVYENKPRPCKATYAK